jgi:two-component system response regulator HydG
MNTVERGVVLSRSEYLDEGQMPLDLNGESSRNGMPGIEAIPAELPLEEVEKATILKTLDSAGGNKSETARRLGITRRTLHKKLKKYGVMS